MLLNHKNMKTMRFLAIMSLCAIMPMASSAQENLKKAIENFVSDKGLGQYIKSSISTENRTKDNGVMTTSYYKAYAFKLPKNKQKELEKVLKAFEKDMDVAYEVKSKDAEMDNTSTKLVYGEDLDKSIRFGGHWDRNYRLMLVRDKEDSLRRYAYAIYWHDDEKTGQRDGQITEIYSPDPQKRKSKDKSLAETIQEALGKIRSQDPNSGKVIFSDEGFTINEIENGTDFLKRFSALRTAYLNPSLNKWHSVKTALINKLVEMCSKHGKLLTRAERSTCIKGIQSMIRGTNDTYDRELLSLAISNLH